MHEILQALLPVMIKAAMDLHEQPSQYGPGEGGGDYTRGQAELIADVIGIPHDIAHSTLMPALYSGKPVAQIAAIVIQETREYQS